MLRVDADQHLSVLDYAPKYLLRGVFKLRVAGQLRSDHCNFLFVCKFLPCVHHVRRPVAGTVQ